MAVRPPRTKKIDGVARRSRVPSSPLSSLSSTRASPRACPSRPSIPPPPPRHRVSEIVPVFSRNARRRSRRRRRRDGRASSDTLAAALTPSPLSRDARVLSTRDLRTRSRHFPGSPGSGSTLSHLFVGRGRIHDGIPPRIEPAHRSGHRPGRCLPSRANSARADAATAPRGTVRARAPPPPRISAATRRSERTPAPYSPRARSEEARPDPETAGGE